VEDRGFGFAMELLFAGIDESSFYDGMGGRYETGRVPTTFSTSRPSLDKPYLVFPDLTRPVDVSLNRKSIS
jgi:hypothetical protein